MAATPLDYPGASTPALSRRARRMRDAPRRAGDAIEASLLEAARALVETGEFQTAPIGAIAKRASISRQGFYFYYQSKDELLAQLVTETLNSGQPWRITLYHEGFAEPAQAIHEVIFSTITMWRQHRETLRAAVEVGPRSPILFAHWSASVHETAEFLSDLVITSTRFKELRDPNAARRMLVALIWMISQNCYMHVVHGSDESDLVWAQRQIDISTRAIGVR